MNFFSNLFENKNKKNNKSKKKNSLNRSKKIHPLSISKKNESYTPHSWRQYEIKSKKSSLKNKSSKSPISSNSYCSFDNINLKDNKEECNSYMNFLALSYSKDNIKNELFELKRLKNEEVLGELNCKELEKNILEIYKEYSKYKNCDFFKKIKILSILGHNFKEQHLSLINLTFKSFSNINKIILEVYPNFQLKEDDINIYKNKYNIDLYLKKMKNSKIIEAIKK